MQCQHYIQQPINTYIVDWTSTSVHGSPCKSASIVAQMILPFLISCAHCRFASAWQWNRDTNSSDPSATHVTVVGVPLIRAFALPSVTVFSHPQFTSATGMVTSTHSSRHTCSCHGAAVSWWNFSFTLWNFCITHWDFSITQWTFSVTHWNSSFTQWNFCITHWNFSFTQGTFSVMHWNFSVIQRDSLCTQWNFPPITTLHSLPHPWPAVFPYSSAWTKPSASIYCARALDCHITFRCDINVRVGNNYHHP